MNTTEASLALKIKIGLFTILGLLLVGGVTVYVNDKPYWWRPCQLVHINIADATGLKAKSPVKSLGLEIGYLKSIKLSETSVDLGICITAPVDVLPSTRAYIRSEGFMGDKFVELKPVKYVGEEKKGTDVSFLSFLEPEAFADPDPQATATREIPVGEGSQDVQHLVNRVDKLVNQISNLTQNIQSSINPEQLHKTVEELNKTLENASRTLSPSGGLNQTAQRTLAKLEDAIEQLRDIMTRVNQGKGSVGMLLNDPKYADEIQEAIKSLNKLLNKVANVRFVVDLGTEYLRGYGSARGWFNVGIWPNPERYYLIGIAVDPRGQITESTTMTTTTVGSVNTTVQTNQTQIVQTGLQFTAMLGKVFWKRLDLSAGVLYNDGTGSAAVWLGPKGLEDRIILRTDIYSQGYGAGEQGLDDRTTLTISPWKMLYLRGGLESIHTVNGLVPFFAGAGIAFDDEDIKILFALK